MVKAVASSLSTALRVVASNPAWDILCVSNESFSLWIFIVSVIYILGNPFEALSKCHINDWLRDSNWYSYE